MAKIIPASRPKIAETEARILLAPFMLTASIIILAIRGYYENSMGAPGKNDRGMYDDAMILLTEKVYRTFNANVDPSVFRKNIATLQCGVYDVVKWRHRGKYEAFQIVKDKVKRDGQGDKLDIGRHGINIHFGSDTATWSEGCQTLPQKQFFELRELVHSEMKRIGTDKLCYVLIDNP